MKNLTGKTFLILCVLMAAVLLPCVAFSAGFVRPTAEYSADRIMTGAASMTAKVYAAPEKERMEIKEGGGVVSIVRMDKNLVWTLIASQKMYMESNWKRAQGDYGNCDVRQTEKGREEINGFQTRKMEIDISCPDNEKYTGMVWMTKENIPVLIETSKVGSKKEAMRIELKNLKIGKQDPALFEVPAGYKMMKMPSFGGK